MPVHFIESAGSPAMMWPQENQCTRSFVSKELHHSQQVNRRNVSAVKPVVGGWLRRRNKRRQLARVRNRGSSG